MVAVPKSLVCDNTILSLKRDVDVVDKCSLCATIYISVYLEDTQSTHLKRLYNGTRWRVISGLSIRLQ